MDVRSAEGRAAARQLAADGAEYEDRSELGAAEDCYRRSSLELTALGEDIDAAEVDLNLGNVLHRDGRFEESAACFDRTVRRLRSLGALHEAAYALVNLGNVLQDQLRWAAALECLEQGQLELDQLGDANGAALVRVNIAAVHEDCGAWETAAACYEDAAATLKSLGDDDACARALDRLGLMRQLTGAWSQASDCYRESRRLHESLGHDRMATEALHNLAVVQLSQHHLGDATTNAEHCLDEFRADGNAEQEVRTLALLMLTLEARGDIEAAGARRDEALRLVDDVDHVQTDPTVVPLAAWLHSPHGPGLVA